MSLRIVLNPSSEELMRVEAMYPANPFCCADYVFARREQGASVVLFTEPSVNGGLTAAIGYLRGRAISRTLEITSAPVPDNAGAFWNSVLQFCRDRRIAEVEIGTYGARAALLPSWPTSTTLRERTEWVMHLAHASSRQMSTNHQRNIKKARKLGVTIMSTTDPAAAQPHVELMAASMQRRDDRGEFVPSIDAGDARDERILLSSGVARIYQALYRGQVVSSLLVLNSQYGAYYQSAGTSPDGMATGASTFLISETIDELAAAGRAIFNLGGAGPENAGLSRFKAGFGALPVSLTAGVYQLASPMHRTLRSAVRGIQRPAMLGSWFRQRLAASG